MRSISFFSLAAILCLLSPAHGQQGSPLVLIQTISLPSVQGGFNHISVDAAGLRLFAAAPANKTLEVVDLKDGKPWRTLAGERPAAVRFAPEFNQLYLSSGQSVYIYDGSTYGLIASIDLGSSLDELQYDARAKRLYAGCMTAGKTGVAVLSIPDGKLLGVIPLPDKPQGIAVEHAGNRIFANMPNLQQVAVMDGEKRKVVSTWQLRDGVGNVPIGLDEAHHRLFIGARTPAQLLVLDTASGKTIATVDSSSDADDLFYDAARKRIYISCGEGFIDVIDQRDPNHYQLRMRIPTVAGARTSAFSAALNRFYLAVARRGDQPAELRVFRVEN